MDWTAFITFLGESDEWLIPLLFSIIFALFSIINSTNQSKQQVTQISIELIEKRLKYYNACNEALTTIVRTGNASNEVIRDFQERMFDVEFFFGQDVKKFVAETGVLMEKLQILQIQRDAPGSSNATLDPQLSVLNCLDELSRMRQFLQSTFSVYLDYSCYKSSGIKGK